MTRPVITAQKLTAQAREHGEVVLPENALLTPSAKDWLLGAKVPVRTDGAEAPQPKGPRFYLLGDGGDPYLKALLPDLERRFPSLEFLSCNNDRRCLLESLRRVCSDLSKSPARRAVAILEHGGITSCVANKQARVRAAILDQPSALRMLTRELGINLLILEKGRFAVGQARASIETFLTGRTSTDPRVAPFLPPMGLGDEPERGA